MGIPDQREWFIEAACELGCDKDLAVLKTELSVV
jgi:hypothetical protein